MKYKFLNHTADLAIEFRGNSMEHLFENSATALSEIIFEQSYSNLDKKKNEIELKFNSDQISEIYLNFLREILYEINVNFRYFHSIKFKAKSSNGFMCQCYFVPRKFSDIQREIKAVTYHDFSFRNVSKNYYAQVIFDI